MMEHWRSTAANCALRIVLLAMFGCAEHHVVFDPTTCGDDVCSEREYCDFPDDSCSGDGVCRDRPGGCLADATGACACNGVTYSNACGAFANGVDVDVHGRCEPFDEDRPNRCGSTFCSWDEYCEVRVVDGVTRHRCELFPAECRRNDCACLIDEECGVSCRRLLGTVTLTCTDI